MLVAGCQFQNPSLSESLEDRDPTLYQPNLDGFGWWPEKRRNTPNSLPGQPSAHDYLCQKSSSFKRSQNEEIEALRLCAIPHMISIRVKRVSSAGDDRLRVLRWEGIRRWSDRLPFLCLTNRPESVDVRCGCLENDRMTTRLNCPQSRNRIRGLLKGLGSGLYLIR